MGCLLKMSPTQQRDLSQIHTGINKYYVTGTTTENRRGKEKKKKTGHDHNKAKARWICCCLGEDIAEQTF